EGRASVPEPSRGGGGFGAGAAEHGLRRRMPTAVHSAVAAPVMLWGQRAARSRPATSRGVGPFERGGSAVRPTAPGGTRTRRRAGGGRAGREREGPARDRSSAPTTPRGATQRPGTIETFT